MKIVPKNLTELDRLAFTVRAIETECQIVPVGTFKMCEQHELRYNDSFKGLRQDKLSLGDFCHFRYPLKAEVVQRMGTYFDIVESANCIFSNDFLEKIECEDHWALQGDCS